MNYMEQVANIIVVKIGDEFELEGCDCKYKLNKEDGLLQHCDDGNGWKCVPFSLLGILTGMVEIKRKPFKPEYNEHYYFVNSIGIICEDFFTNMNVDYYRYNYGNCFRAREEITDEIKDEILKKIKKKYESEE